MEGEWGNLSLSHPGHPPLPPQRSPFLIIHELKTIKAISLRIWKILALELSRLATLTACEWGLALPPFGP